MRARNTSIRRAASMWPRSARSVLASALALLVLAFAADARAASYPYATQTGTVGTPYAVGTGLTFTPNRDDGTAPVTLPFTFNLFGHQYLAGTTLRVSTNGVLEFGDNSTEFHNEPLPSAAFSQPAILPYWTDFDLTVTYDVVPSGDGEGASWGVSGTAPSRVLAIQWWGYKHGTSPESRISFQVALHEGSNEIDTIYFRYLTDPMANGSTATIGLQEGGIGGASLQYSHLSPVISGSTFWIEYYPRYPSIVGHPVVSGTPAVGQTLSVSTGTWSGSPDSYQYQWERCTDSACGGWQNIAGATGSTYVVQAADVNSRLFAAVKAVNGWGASGWDFAYFVGPVPAPVPTNSAAPAVSGQAQVGASARRSRPRTAPGRARRTPTATSGSGARRAAA